MKMPIRSALFAIAAFLSPYLTNAQCIVSSTSGYSVHLLVRPEAVLPSTDVCAYGYTYKVRMAYDISFSGTNVPSSMYTLQGTITCGTTTIFFDLPNGGGSGTVLSSNAYTSRTDCATATPAALSCNTVKIQIQGPSLSNRTIACSFSPLPIELVAFEATAMHNNVQLDWTTASEKDNDHFTIERSADAIAFMDILRLPAAGQSTTLQYYHGSDDAPLAGTAYYRLRQTDFDGNQSWSPMVAVHNDRPNTFTIFPNPAQGDVLRFATDESGWTLQLYSTSGMLVHTTLVQHNRIQLPPLPSGIYEARLTHPRSATVRTARFVKE